MKVLDLQCAQHHVFEGWFGSEDDFQSQLARGVLTCPMCGDAHVTKKLCAPRLNLNTTRGEREGVGHNTCPSQVSEVEATPSTATPTPASAVLPSMQEVGNLKSEQLQAAFLKMVRHVVANTEDVGDSFPEEARKIHYGETEARNIRGHATAQETEELIHEGIDVMPLPLPDLLKESLN